MSVWAACLAGDHGDCPSFDPGLGLPDSSCDCECHDPPADSVLVAE